jgi:arsenite oxidase large subunit
VTDPHLPLPPTDATVTQTVCQYCNVGCGYTAYTWPEGRDGGPAPGDNALGADFRSPQPALVGVPYTRAMVSTTDGQDGVRRTVAVVPAADSDVNRRRDHSARGAANAQSTFCRTRPTADRLTHPLLRVGDHLVRVTWAEAIEVLARVLVGVRDRDGADAVCAKAFDHGGGGGGFENNYAVGKLLFTGLGTRMVAIHNRPAYNSEVWGSRDRGVHELHWTAEDARVCDTLVLWGANTYETATVLFTEHVLPHFLGETAAERQAALDPGERAEPLRVVVVDPRRTSTVTVLQHLDPDRVLHLRPAPGTDLVVANAIARVVHERRWHDAAMLEGRTDAAAFAEVLATDLGGKTPLPKFLAEASKTSGVPVADLVKAAEWTCRPKAGGARRRTLTIYEKGVIWNLRNHDTVGALVQLAVLGGNLGRAGTGCGRQGGHQEGYVRPDYPGPRPPPNVDQHLIDGRGQVFWVMGTNPYLTTPRAQQYRRALGARTAALTAALGQARGGEPATPEARADAIVRALGAGSGLFLVVSELYLTETARDAHLVLPAAGWGEMDLTSINCHSRLLRLYGRFVDPPGAAVPDWEICARTARRVEALYTAAGRPAEAARFAGFDWETSEDVFLAGGATFPDNRVDEVGAESLPCETYTGVDYALLRQLGQRGIQTPVRRDASGAVVGTKRRYVHRFGSADGRFHWAPTGGWTGYPPEVSRYLERAEQFPFWLTTGRSQRLWQTGYHDARVPEKVAEVPLPYVELHPEDAARLGVSAGELVEVWNDEGNLVAEAHVLDGPPVGMVFALQFHPLGTANDLTSAYTDPKTTIPWYKGARVAVRRLAPDAGDPTAVSSALPNNHFS